MPCGLWDLSGNDEGRYVQVGKELRSSSNWLVLTVHGEPYDEKPPLAFWTFAALIWLQGGVSSSLLRLPAALAATAAVVFTYIIGRHRFSPRAGMAAAYVLMTAPIFYQHAMAARLDMMYASWTLLALTALLTREEGRRMSGVRSGLFWLGLTGAFFTKGPLALVFVFALIGYQARSARSWEPLRSLRPLAGASVLVGLIAVWLWAQSTGVSTEFVKGQISDQIFERLVRGSHREPPWFYLSHMFTGLFMPWTLWLIPALVHACRTRDAASRSIRPLIFYAGFAFVLCSVIPGKRQTYLLPVLPALALIVGGYLDGVIEAPGDRSRLARVGCVVVWAASLSTLALGTCLALSPRHFARVGDLLSAIPGIPIAAGMGQAQLAACLLAASLAAGVAAAVWRRAGDGDVALRGLVAVLLLYYTAGYVTAKTLVDPLESTRDFSNAAERLLQEPGEPRAVGVLGKAQKPKYHVYGSYAVQHLSPGRQTFAHPDALPSIIAMDEPTWRAHSSIVEEAGYELAYRGHKAAEGILLCARRPRLGGV